MLQYLFVFESFYKLLHPFMSGKRRGLRHLTWKWQAVVCFKGRLCLSFDVKHRPRFCTSPRVSPEPRPPWPNKFAQTPSPLPPKSAQVTSLNPKRSFPHVPQFHPSMPKKLTSSWKHLRCKTCSQGNCTQGTASLASDLSRQMAHDEPSWQNGADGSDGKDKNVARLVIFKKNWWM